ncbi:MAG: TetR/AcrR family transcriptional regulator [Chloroflexales bacterium]|nr:TetR/AcrR family transcriptional regulator [Chloroflexales bacterium]
MPRPINHQLRQARADDILAAARQQLAEHGTEGLSLRAIARRLDLAPNSLYNYFPSLDDLITALLVDAFGRFAEAVTAATASSAGNSSWAQRFATICAAYRSWAVTNRTDYDLIFGSAIPGYHAPEDVTGPLGLRSFQSALRLLIDAWRAGALAIPARYQAVPPEVAPHLHLLMQPDEADAPLAIAFLMLVVWSRLHGMVMLENHGHYDSAVGETAAFYAHAVSCLIDEIGLRGT